MSIVATHIECDNSKPDGLDRLLADVTGRYTATVLPAGGGVVKRGEKIVAAYETYSTAQAVASAMNVATARHLPESRPPNRREAELILAYVEDGERFDGLS